MTSLEDFQAYRNQVSQAKDAYLGHVVLWDVSDLSVKHSFVKAELDRVGLGAMVFGPPNDADLFRRTFSNGQRRKHATADPQITEQLLIRTVSATSERIVRRVVSELVDAGGETLSYQEVHQIEYNLNHPDRLVTDELEPNLNAAKLIDELRAEYEANQGCVNGNAIRGIISRTLSACLATNLRGRAGGAYFVSDDHVGMVRALEEFAGTISEVRVNSFPLVDDRKQRAMVKRAIDEDMSTNLERAMVELGEVLMSGETISQRKFATLSGKVAEIKAKAQEYSALLQTSVTGSQDRLDILQGQISALYGRVA